MFVFVIVLSTVVQDTLGLCGSCGKIVQIMVDKKKNNNSNNENVNLSFWRHSSPRIFPSFRLQSENEMKIVVYENDSVLVSNSLYFCKITWAYFNSYWKRKKYERSSANLREWQGFLQWKINVVVIFAILVEKTG